MLTISLCSLLVGYAVPVLVSSALISVNKAVRSSSQHAAWAAERIVDGNLRTDADICKCCAATLDSFNPWYELDLGQIYTIRKIAVKGRHNGKNVVYNQTFEGMKILLNSIDDGFDEAELTIQEDSIYIEYKLPSPISSRYTSLVLYNRTRVFTVCELDVYGDCQAGEFGGKCEDTCYCEGDPCDDTGVCPSGLCRPGYQGQSCNIGCNAGLYGSGCIESCGNCFNQTTCNPIDGACHGGVCAPGFQGDLCKQECEDGLYGEHCLEKCGKCLNSNPCYKVNGSCQGCIPGYEGHDCKLALKVDDKSENSFWIIGGSIGAVLAVICLVVALLILKRRNLKKANGNNSRTEVNDKSVKMKVQIEEKDETNTSKETTAYFYSLQNKSYCIRVCQLWDFIKREEKNDYFELRQEFNSLLTGLQYSCDTASLSVNRSKNLYKDLCAYDYNRVPVKTENSDNDYINASFIYVTEVPYRFIASQGPTNEMRGDFLQMIWQQKIEKIVIVADSNGGNTKNNLAYWDENKEVTFGDVSLKVITSSSNSNFAVRKMKIRKNTERWRNITLYQFNAWPDKGVPDNAYTLVKFWRAIMTDVHDISIPILVHCSTGTGRTGTFIALDIAYNQAKAEGTIRMLNIVKSLREQRVNMVDTEEQYRFLFEALAEALLVGTRSVSSNDFEEIYDYILLTDSKNNEQRLHTQYKLVMESFEGDGNEDHGYQNIDPTFYQNIPWNNHGEVTLALDADGEYMSLQDSNDYSTELCTVSLPAYNGQNAFIVSQSSNPASNEALISLIVKKNVRTMVELHDVPSSDEENSTGHRQLARFSRSANGFKLTKESIWETYCQQEFEIVRNGTCSKVSQFEYVSWRSNSPSKADARPILEFLNTVMTWQHSLSDEHPVLVHCRSDSTRNGMVYILLNELERMRRENRHINIVESAKLMMERDESIALSFNQYKFIHDVILEASKEENYEIV